MQKYNWPLIIYMSILLGVVTNFYLKNEAEIAQFKEERRLKEEQHLKEKQYLKGEGDLEEDKIRLQERHFKDLSILEYLDKPDIILKPRESKEAIIS